MTRNSYKSAEMQRIKEHVKSGNYRFTVHGFERCVERNIAPNEVKYAIISGEVIEDYPRDKYGPSCLICGVNEEGKLLHVQCSIDPIWIITVYDPTLNPEEWDKDFKRRRIKS